MKRIAVLAVVAFALTVLAGVLVGGMGISGDGVDVPQAIGVGMGQGMYDW